MRFLLILFALSGCFGLHAQISAGFTLDELHLKRFDSKKKYPATILRYEPDAFTDLVTVKIFKGKSLYSGNMIEEKNGNSVNASVSEGIITHFVSDDKENARRQVYNVTVSAYYPWYATDSIFYDNELFSSTVFYENADGQVMMVTRQYNAGNFVTEYAYRIGKRSDGTHEYNEPLEEGRLCGYHNGHLLSYETYHDGKLDGEIAFFDEKNTLLQKFYVNATTGVYGKYYEYDTVRHVVTVGYYNERGTETGQWISRYADSSVARILWISANGNPDSSKSWDQKGNLVAVEYNYWKPSASPGSKDYVHYSRSWFSNGQTALWLNYNPQLHDTIMAQFSVTGIPVAVECNMGNRVQRRTWHDNGHPETERYGVATGVSGITVRDSVYREWNAGGTLYKERYYDKGKFIRSNDPPGSNVTDRPVPVQWYSAAHLVATATPVKQRSWDSAYAVPLPVIDSLASFLDGVHFSCMLRNQNGMKELENVSSNQYERISGEPVYYSTLLLTGMEFVTLDSAGKIHTSNAELNRFLDSLQLSGIGVAPRGNYTRKKGKTLSDFSVTVTCTGEWLNFYSINRRLQAIAPGSHMSNYNRSTAALPAEIIYIPQGEQTGFGITPVTVVAVAGDGEPSALTSGTKSVQADRRTFYIFYVYADGEVEFTRTSHKDTILLQYRGERTGVYARSK
jgi:antitoxin component YwqK of YwqJK toxin-antitoxin module